MKKAVLIFGSFNPVTNAHINLGKMARKNIPDADIWYIPASDAFVLRKMKGLIFLTSQERLMLLSKVAHLHNFYVSDVEINNVTDGYTYNTANFFKDVLHYDEIYICIGSDKLWQIPKWFQAEYLVKEYKFLVFERNDSDMESLNNAYIQNNMEQFVFVKNNDSFKEVSSTKIRDAVNTQSLLSVQKDIPKIVFEYLNKKYIEEKNYGI